MNPEEGELRPQLLDRFGLQANMESIADAGGRYFSIDHLTSGQVHDIVAHEQEHVMEIYRGM